MASIPFDPTLVLGNICDKEKIVQLEEIATITQKQIEAQDKLDNLIRMDYSLKMLEQELQNMDVTFDKLAPLKKKMTDVKDATVKAAIEYANVAMKCEDEVRVAKDKHKQTQISMSAESPIDYGKSKVATFPLSFDSLKFDVQYVRNEEEKDGTQSFSESVSHSVSSSLKHFGSHVNGSTSSSRNSSGVTTSNSNKIEGTVVITAYVTHKNANVIEPFIFDARKIITSWNYTFPKDVIKTDPKSIFEAALDNYKKPLAKQSTIELLSGCTKASSFVGFVHMLKTEKTTSSQNAASAASAMKTSIEAQLFIASASGKYGTSSSAAAMSKSLTSTSDIQNHATLTCEGMIPNIAADDVVATIMQMKPDPSEVMNQMGAISGASDTSVNDSMEASAGEAKGGSQFMELNNSYAAATVSSLTEKAGEANKVINVNSMMNAFTDFCDKAIAGEGGVPINFYLKRLTKADCAKVYIRKFYPNGATTSKEARRGQMGQDPAEGDSEGGGGNSGGGGGDSGGGGSESEGGGGE